jgi:hypothetical protein
MPDPAISLGYGQAFIQRGWGTWGHRPYTDVMTAVDGAVGPTRDDATEPFARAYLSTMVTDVGIGFWLSGDEAWIALSFH